MPQNALCVENERIVVAPPVSCHIPDTIASLHKFLDVIGPTSLPCFSGRYYGRLTKMLPNFTLRGPIFSR